MVGATPAARMALRTHACTITREAAGLSSAVLVQQLPPPAIVAASRNYARMRNRSPPAPRKELESESDSSSSDEEEAVDRYSVDREDDLDSEESEFFVLDFGAGDKENDESGGEDD
ncbi:hypothetical protein KSP40_PGU008486 [Platanthera guangdongensis]|uniref:Uncharacterized protein n=1 Tax=Platanthera guangdongensis TaxID=2320717 RepID=A0ABR2LGD1_9ASPA